MFCCLGFFWGEGCLRARPPPLLLPLPRPLRGGAGSGSGAAQRGWARSFRRPARGRRRAAPGETACPGPPPRGPASCLIHGPSSIIDAAPTPAPSRLPFTPAHLFSFPFPKGQPRRSPEEGESRSAGLGFVCLNIELENIPLCGLVNNESDRFAFPVNDTGKLSG